MSVKEFIPAPVKTFLLKGYTQFNKCKRSLKVQRFLLDAKLHPADAVCYCPCCGHRFRSFIDGQYSKNTSFFDPKRYRVVDQDVVCPICGTIPRHRIQAVWFTKHKEELKNSSILYFACEPGLKRWMKRNGVSCTTADYYADADLKLDLCDIDQPDNSWDWVICNNVLEHVDSYQPALRELYRILKPGGKLIITFPILSSLSTVIEETEHTEENKKKRRELYGQSDHLRIFGADSVDMLTGYGFRVSVIDGSKLDKRIRPVVGPADYDVNYLFLCTKP